MRLSATHMPRSDCRARQRPAAIAEASAQQAASPELASTSPLPFERITARTMRQVLVEAACRRSVGKRGGADAVFVTSDESLHNAAEQPPKAQCDFVRAEKRR